MNTKPKATKLSSLNLGGGGVAGRRQNITNLLLVLPHHYSMLLLFILCFRMQHFLKEREIKIDLLGVTTSADTLVAIEHGRSDTYSLLAPLTNPAETLNILLIN